jgi:hypothetical protein
MQGWVLVDLQVPILLEVNELLFWQQVGSVD